MEYKVLKFNGQNADASTSLLNAEATDGWKFSGILTQGSYQVGDANFSTILLERPVTTEEESAK